MRPVISYIEVSDGFVPTRPAPVVARTRNGCSDKLWDVTVIDQHSVEHDFLTDVTEAEAEACAQALAAATLMLTPSQIITVQKLNDILAAFVNGDEAA